MLVKELIEKLQKVDPELEIVVSPEVYVPVFGSDSMEKISDPFTRYGIEKVGLTREFDGKDDPMRVVLAIDRPGAADVSLIG